MHVEDMKLEPELVDKQTIAILPFKNMSSDPENEYFADGVTEELIIALSRIERLKVISRTSAMRYKTTSKGAIEIARELTADTLVEGSVRKAAAQVRISVQLIDGRDEGNLWAQTYDRKLDDIFAVQTEIAEKVVEALQVKLQESERRGLRKRPTSSSEAYSLYLKGRFHLTRYSEAEVRKAAGTLRAGDQTRRPVPSAYAMTAQCDMFLGFFGFVAPSEGLEKARPLLRRALEIDDRLDIAHMLMGRLLMDADWDWSGAEAEFRRAIEMSPNSAEAHYRYALLLNDLLRNAEALAEIKIAEGLDPLSVAVSQVAGSIFYSAGRNGEAIERLRRAIESTRRGVRARQPWPRPLSGRQGRRRPGRNQEGAGTRSEQRRVHDRPLLCLRERRHDGQGPRDPRQGRGGPGEEKRRPCSSGGARWDVFLHGADR